MAEQQARQGFTNWMREQFRLPQSAADWARLGGQVGAGVMLGPAGSLAFGQLFQNGGFQNPLNGLVAAGRGVGSSLGRLFDGDPSTGFGNNPTAPWNWGQGPRNVPAGHPDFVGPPAPGGFGNSGSDNIFSGGFGGRVSNPFTGAGSLAYAGTQAQRDAANSLSDVQAAQDAYNRATSAGYGAQFTSGLQGSGVTAGQAFNYDAPSHWRRVGTAESQRGPQNNRPMTPQEQSYMRTAAAMNSLNAFGNDRGTIQRNDAIR